MAEKVNHPSHYGGDTTYEHIKVVEAWGLNYALGNATKYICRAGKKTKDELEDLEKARWYLEHEIARVKREREPHPPTIMRAEKPTPLFDEEKTFKLPPVVPSDPQLSRHYDVKLEFNNLDLRYDGPKIPIRKMCRLETCIAQARPGYDYCFAHGGLERP